MTYPTRALASLLVTILPLAACSEPDPEPPPPPPPDHLSAAEVRTRIDAGLRPLLDSLWTHVPGSGLDVGRVRASIGVLAPLLGGMRLFDSDPGDAFTAMVDVGLDETTSPAATDHAIAWLVDEVFSTANYRGAGAFAVSPALLCTSPGGVADPACADALAAIDARLVTQDVAGDLRVSLVVGADGHRPIVVELGTALDASIDLAELAAVPELVAAIAGEPVLAARGAGTLTARVTAAAAGFDADLTSDGPLAWATAPTAAELDGASGTRLELAGARFHLFADSIAYAGIRITLDAPLTVAFPVEDVPGSSFVLDSPGLEIAILGNESLAELDLWLGGSTTSLFRDGLRVAAIDLFGESTRRLSLIHQPTLSGDIRLGIDLRTDVDHVALQGFAPAYRITRVVTGFGASYFTPTPTMPRPTLWRVTNPLRITTDPSAYSLDAGTATTHCVYRDDFDDGTQIFEVWWAYNCP